MMTNPDTGKETPRCDAELRSLLSEFPEPLTDGNKMLYYISATAAFQDLARTLERELAARQWIAVSERLPEEYVTVLIWDRRVPAFVGPITAFRIGDRWMQDDARGDNFACSHWQPLPEPPTENNDERRQRRPA